MAVALKETFTSFPSSSDRLFQGMIRHIGNERKSAIELDLLIKPQGNDLHQSFPGNTFLALVASLEGWMERVTFSGRMQRTTASPKWASPTASISCPETEATKVPPSLLDHPSGQNRLHPHKGGDKLFTGWFITSSGVPDLKDLSSIHHSDSIRKPQGFQPVVSGKDRRCPCLSQDTFQIFDQRFPAGRIKGGKGFIEKKDLRLNGKGPGKTCPLRLSSGKGSGRTVAEVADSEPVQMLRHHDLEFLAPSSLGFLILKQHCQRPWYQRGEAPERPWQAFFGIQRRNDSNSTLLPFEEDLTLKGL